MPGFQEIWPLSGVDDAAQPPFIVIPRGEFRFIHFQTAKGFAVPPGNRFVDVRDVTGVSPAKVFAALARSDVAGKVMAGFLDLIGGFGSPGSGKRLVVLRGKTVGLQHIKGLDVAVVVAKTSTVSFRYLHWSDPDGNSRGTARKPGDAAALIGSINDIFSPQAAVSFDLKKADDLTIAARMGPKLTDAIYDAHLTGEYDQGANITVFLGGAYARANGTTKTLGSKKGLLVSETADRFHDDVDPFVNALAHELGHAVGADHSARSNVLMTDADHGVTSLKISSDTVKQIHGL